MEDKISYTPQEVADIARAYSSLNEGLKRLTNLSDGDSKSYSFLRYEARKFLGSIPKNVRDDMVEISDLLKLVEEASLNQE